MTLTPIVQAHGIARRDALRGTTLLQPTDFALYGGDQVAITGPSGAGKSVLLRALALLDPLSSGSVRWRGRPVTRAAIPLYRREIAYVRQRAAILDGTVEDNLRYPYSLRVYRDLRFDRGVARELAAHAGRGADFLERDASDLSGGEAQLMALIRVLQLQPQALLLDEPTASLDPESALAGEALIRAWFAQGTSPRAWVWISHDTAQALRVGTRQLTMRAGVLSEAATPAAAGTASAREATTQDPPDAQHTREVRDTRTARGIDKESTR
ncbi:MAG TPA: ATP-binding cassette domain-containing protein [Paraburkholderia sp.]|jgi:putative ABC transport system ATP-binding protein|nr:ATP-binding cassette domain-containing protein [Paraburkholderia sp.]